MLSSGGPASDFTEGTQGRGPALAAHLLLPLRPPPASLAARACAAFDSGRDLADAVVLLRSLPLLPLESDNCLLCCGCFSALLRGRCHIFGSGACRVWHGGSLAVPCAPLTVVAPTQLLLTLLMKNVHHPLLLVAPLSMMCLQHRRQRLCVPSPFYVLLDGQNFKQAGVADISKLLGCSLRTLCRCRECICTGAIERL